MAEPLGDPPTQKGRLAVLSLVHILESIANGASDLVEWEAVTELMQEIEDDYGIGRCRELVLGRKCSAPVEPDGKPFRLGQDQDGTPVYFQKWRCVLNHQYHTEVK
jgi:hypothetical protein